MKRYFNILVVLSLLFFMPLCAYDPLLDNPTHLDDYTWELSDPAQKKMGAGMYLWGFAMITFIFLFTGFMPNSPSSTAKGGTAPTSGPLF